MTKRLKNMVVRKFKSGGVFLGIFIVFTLAVLTVDKAAVGPRGSSVGFSHINVKVHEFFGENIFWYNVADFLGIVAIMIMVIFALMGLIQLIKGKSLLKVDPNILALGVLYLVTLVCYVFFEICVVDCRPMLMPGSNELEASYPSSHTILSFIVFGTVFPTAGRYIKDRSTANSLKIICTLLAFLTVIFRFISGVHWLTDIIAGVILAVALLEFHSGFSLYLRSLFVGNKIKPSGRSHEHELFTHFHKDDSYAISPDATDDDLTDDEF